MVVTALTQLSVLLCADLSSTVTLVPLPAHEGGCLQATDSGICIFCNVVLLMFVDRLFLQGKGNKSPKPHVNVKKSSMLLVVVFLHSAK